MYTAYDSHRVPVGWVQKPIPVLCPSFFQRIFSSIKESRHSTLHIHTTFFLKNTSALLSFLLLEKKSPNSSSFQPSTTCHPNPHYQQRSQAGPPDTLIGQILQHGMLKKAASGVLWLRTDTVALLTRGAYSQYVSTAKGLRPCLWKGASWRAWVGRVKQRIFLNIPSN